MISVLLERWHYSSTLRSQRQSHIQVGKMALFLDFTIIEAESHSSWKDGIIPGLQHHRDRVTFKQNGSDIFQ